MHLLDLLHDYQHLRAKADLVSLAPQEAVRLEGLSELLRGDEADEGRRQAPRFGFPRPLPVTIAPRGSDGFIVAGLREIGFAGAALTLEVALPEGRPLILYFDDDERGLRYELPAVVVWQAGGHAGIRFEGMPTRRDLGVQAA
jgi:hypothetical protein